MPVDSTYVVSAAVFGLVLGSVAGRGPQGVAKELGRPGTGMIAVLICMTVGFLCGGIFAFPVAWFLSSWIKGMGPVDTYAGSHAGPSDDDFRRAFRPTPADPAAGPYTAIGPVIVCNKCRHSSSRGRDGAPPPECPSCAHPFTPGGKRRQAAASARGDDDLVELRLAGPSRRR